MPNEKPENKIDKKTDKKLTIIGGGLAGCEAANWAARAGLNVTLYEMKPDVYSPAHRLSGLCELVCSNSLKSTVPDNASGLLKEEMKLLGSLVIEAALATSVPGGSALCVDRERFSGYVTEKLLSLGVEVVRGEIKDIPDPDIEGGPLIIATGPLTSNDFAEKLQAYLGPENLFFYDAISPVIYKESVDFDVAFMGSRYGKGGADYINCPMTKDEYEGFVGELVRAEKTPFREFEKEPSKKTPFFEGCMPVEAIAERGLNTLAFGPMRPVGFTDPRTGTRPHAIVQLRCENTEATLYNLVGFQTSLTRPEQKRVLSMIPGLERVRFARYGSIHRNTYFNSPEVLANTLQLKKDPGIFLAGQITGVEGYCESAMTGIIAGINAVRVFTDRSPLCPPATTMTGALLNYITEPGRKGFQPMNANFGILEGYVKKSKRGECVSRAVAGLDEWREIIFRDRD